MSLQLLLVSLKCPTTIFRLHTDIVIMFLAYNSRIAVILITIDIFIVLHTDIVIMFLAYNSTSAVISITIDFESFFTLTLSLCFLLRTVEVQLYR